MSDSLDTEFVAQTLSFVTDSNVMVSKASKPTTHITVFSQFLVDLGVCVIEKKKERKIERTRVLVTGKMSNVSILTKQFRVPKL